MNRLETLIRRRADERRELAKACASRIVSDANARGVEIAIFGSLAVNRFALHSDVDFLVHGDTSPARRAMVEKLVADGMRGRGIPYDLVFASDISADQVRELLHARV